MMDDPGSPICVMSNLAPDHPGLYSFSPENKSVDVQGKYLNNLKSHMSLAGEEILHPQRHYDCYSWVFIRAADGTTKSKQISCYKCLKQEKLLARVGKWPSYVSRRTD